MRLAVAVAVVLTIDPRPTLAQEAPRAPIDAQADALESALFDAYVGFDGLALLGVFRSAIIGVNESYCALSNLLPDQDGIGTVDALLGIGCLAGAATLFAMTVMRADDIGEENELARDRYLRFQRAREHDLSPGTLARYESELESAADRGATQRLVGTVIGILSFVAAAVIVPLTAAGEIDSTLGVVLGTGTVLVGGMSLVALGVESPAESALRRYRQVRDEVEIGSDPRGSDPMFRGETE